MSLVYAGLHAIARPTLKALWRLRVSGVEHVPESGPVILAANHLSVADHLFLPVACPRLVFFMAKSDYFVETGLKGRVRGLFMRSVGQIPVGLIGTDAVQPLGTLLPRPGREVEIRFGKPLRFARADETRHNAKQLRAMTDDVMERIAELTGQEVLDTYAGRSGSVSSPASSGR